MKPNKPYANFGCGSVYNEALFDNYDFVGTMDKVFQADLRSPLNIPNKKYAFCYSSHTLEHLSYR